VLLTIDSDSIKPSEVVARYLLSSSDYGNSRVKPRALEPSPSDHCTSVFRIDELTENEVWDMGTRLVAAPRARRVHARVDINVSSGLLTK